MNPNEPPHPNAEVHLLDNHDCSPSLSSEIQAYVPNCSLDNLISCLKVLNSWPLHFYPSPCFPNLNEWPIIHSDVGVSSLGIMLDSFPSPYTTPSLNLSHLTFKNIARIHVSLSFLSPLNSSHHNLSAGCCHWLLTGSPESFCLFSLFLHTVAWYM